MKQQELPLMKVDPAGALRNRLYCMYRDYDLAVTKVAGQKYYPSFTFAHYKSNNVIELCITKDAETFGARLLIWRTEPEHRGRHSKELLINKLVNSHADLDHAVTQLLFMEM